MQKYLIPAISFLMLVYAPMQATAQTQPENRIKWSVQQSWQIGTEPLDFAQSLDNTKVFILGSDSQVHVYDINGNKIGSIPVDKGVIAIDIAPRGEALYLINKTKRTYTALDISVIRNIDTSGAPFLGDENAPISIIVFSDFQCPHCRAVHPLLKQVLAQNKGKVKIVFKHFPLQGHDLAKPAALATIAAQNQGKFWAMHDAVFAAQGKIKQHDLEKMAVEIGLDMEQFQKDLAAISTSQRLYKDMADARQAGISGVPALYLNGQKIKNRSLEAIQNMINRELSIKNKQ